MKYEAHRKRGRPSGDSPERWCAVADAVLAEGTEALRFASAALPIVSSLSPEDKAFRLRWKTKTIASLCAIWLLTACGDKPPPSYTFVSVWQTSEQREAGQAGKPRAYCKGLSSSPGC